MVANPLRTIQPDLPLGYLAAARREEPSTVIYNINQLRQKNTSRTYVTPSGPDSNHLWRAKASRANPAVIRASVPDSPKESR